MVKLSKTSQICFRLPKEEKELIEKICDSRGEDLSSFVRRAIKRELARMSYLSEEAKKALEIS
ncbi:MAG: ribbon-helix-helix protein, CopG family [bacterium]